MPFGPIAHCSRTLSQRYKDRLLGMRSQASRITWRQNRIRAWNTHWLSQRGTPQTCLVNLHCLITENQTCVNLAIPNDLSSSALGVRADPASIFPRKSSTLVHYCKLTWSVLEILSLCPLFPSLPTFFRSRLTGLRASVTRHVSSWDSPVFFRTSFLTPHAMMLCCCIACYSHCNMLVQNVGWIVD